MFPTPLVGRPRRFHGFSLIITTWNSVICPSSNFKQKLVRVEKNHRPLTSTILSSMESGFKSTRGEHQSLSGDLTWPNYQTVVSDKQRDPAAIRRERKTQTPDHAQRTEACVLKGARSSAVRLDLSGV
uniref:Auxin-responsive protein n=1 Tax=Mesocestoides corti TaxID=53468 RepID=A0A5K3G2F5_MESCO